MNTYDTHTVAQVSAYFVDKGYSVSATTDEMDHFDLVCSGGKSGTFAVEVKGRNIPMDRYPDMAVDYTKYEAAVSAIEAGEYRNVLVVSVYDDGSMGIGNILSGHEIVAPGPASTHFARRKKTINKRYWDVPRQIECRVN